MSRPRRRFRRLFWIGALLGAAYLFWRWRQQADELGALGAGGLPAPAIPARSDPTPTLTAPADHTSAPRRIPTRVHRGAPPGRAASEPESAAVDLPLDPLNEPEAAAVDLPLDALTEAAPGPADEGAATAFARDMSAGAEPATPPAEPGAPLSGVALDEPNQADTEPVAQTLAPGLAPQVEPNAENQPATLSLAHDGVPESATLADEASAVTFSPGIAPAVRGDEPEVISAGSPDTISEERAPTPPSPEVTSSGIGLVNINSADEDTLVALPGIGRALARRIIAWREEHGPFKTVDELIDIPGIGTRNINEFRAFVTV